MFQEIFKNSHRNIKKTGIIQKVPGNKVPGYSKSSRKIFNSKSSRKYLERNIQFKGSREIFGRFQEYQTVPGNIQMVPRNIQKVPVHIHKVPGNIQKSSRKYPKISRKYSKSFRKYSKGSRKDS